MHHKVQTWDLDTLMFKPRICHSSPWARHLFELETMHTERALLQLELGRIPGSTSGCSVSVKKAAQAQTSVPLSVL